MLKNDSDRRWVGSKSSLSVSWPQIFAQNRITPLCCWACLLLKKKKINQLSDSKTGMKCIHILYLSDNTTVRILLMAWMSEWPANYVGIVQNYSANSPEINLFILFLFVQLNNIIFHIMFPTPVSEYWLANFLITSLVYF